MAIEWTQALATGVDEIDEQHKEIFKRINALLEACRHGRGKSEVGNVMKFLEDYIAEHFNAEERQMSAHQYPGLSAHKAEHLSFIKNYIDLKRQFEAQGPGVHIVVMVNHLVVNWLQDHIKKVDTAFGAFLKTVR